MAKFGEHSDTYTTSEFNHIYEEDVEGGGTDIVFVFNIIYRSTVTGEIVDFKHKKIYLSQFIDARVR